ncbi:hypothetical protein S40293_09872 [Stachybotrys chartarum IBT 40293]|nr:hypothetical protein S40293_09872 [Stachybotrys chartarum IBT 40293]
MKTNTKSQLIIERVHAAIHQNDLHLLAELLSKNLALIHASSFKGTYLAVAVSCDNAAAVRILLDHGARIDVRLPEHGPALLGQAVRRFEKQGADPNTHWENGVTALHLFAFPLDKNCLERSDAPWERMPKHNFGRDGATPSHLAAEAADRDTFIHHFLPAESGLTSTNRFGESLLHYAAAGGRHDILDYLLSRYGDRFNVNAANNFGWTPLICALAPNRRTSKFEADAVKSARLLLSYGADLKEWVDEDPSSPGDRYIFDVDGNAIECWEGMSEPERQRELAYPDPDTSAEALACELLSKSSELLPPIQSPAKLFYGSFNSKSYMISTARHPYDKERLGGKTSKACAEAKEYYRNSSDGERPQSSDVPNPQLRRPPKHPRIVYNRTPLHWAASHGAAGVARVLCKMGKADYQACDGEGKTPLDLACDFSQNEALRIGTMNAVDWQSS